MTGVRATAIVIVLVVRVRVYGWVPGPRCRGGLPRTTDDHAGRFIPGVGPSAGCVALLPCCSGVGVVVPVTGSFVAVWLQEY